MSTFTINRAFAASTNERFSKISSLEQWHAFVFPSTDESDLNNNSIHPYFSLILDEDIFLEIVRKNSPEISIGIVGSHHIENLVNSLKSYGYIEDKSEECSLCLDSSFYNIISDNSQKHIDL